MTPEERNPLIDRYAAGYLEVTSALEGFPEKSLGAHPLPGKWSAREIVHHLADSETESSTRLRRLLGEEYPVIYGYDQETFAILLRYNLREDIQPSLDAFRAAREISLQIMNLMTEEDWARRGWHMEHGLYAVTTWLQIYARHAHNHASQIRRLKETLEKK